LDFLRRKALGRLAEVVGPPGVESDVLSRTLGLPQLAQAEWETLGDDVRLLLQAYTDGINALIEATRDRPPIEFELLDYLPGPWEQPDGLAILRHFRWSPTGRFPVIMIPELVKQAVGDGPLLRAFLTAEADGESILQPGEYPLVREAPHPGEVPTPSGDGAGG